MNFISLYEVNLRIVRGELLMGDNYCYQKNNLNELVWNAEALNFLMN